MIKQLLLTAISYLLLLNVLLAQHEVSGRVLDNEGAPLGYVSVVLLDPADSAMKTFGVTAPDGAYQIKNIKKGRYVIQYSFIGMTAQYITVDVPLPDNEGLDDIILEPSALDEVVIEAEKVPLVFANDTLEFNTQAFNTRSGASVEELLEKLPGIEVDEHGNLRAQGENVVKILVNGKEYFSEDPKMATKNLPAEAVNKVQVFDRKSEAAAFSGIEDGHRDRTINLVLKKSHESRYFGQITAGGGTGKTFNTEGKLNRFSKSVQTSVMTMFNNINAFGFTDKGARQYGQNIKGLNKNFSGGANFLYTTSPENRYFIQYLGGQTNQYLTEYTVTENYLPSLSYFQNLDLLRNDKRVPQNISAGIRHNFNKNNRLIADVNLNNNRLNSHSFGIMNTYQATGKTNYLENNLDDTYIDKFHHASVTYISKFNDERTQLQINSSGIQKEAVARQERTNFSVIYSPFSEEFAEEEWDNVLEEVFVSLRPSLVQKLNDVWTVSGSGNVGLNTEELFQTEGALDSSGQMQDYTWPVMTASERFFRPTMSLQRATDKLLVHFSVEGVFNEFDRIFDGEIVPTNYRYVLPNFRFRNEYKKGRRVETAYSTKVSMPSARSLCPVPNRQNRLAIIDGNVHLRPEYYHNLSLTWSLFDETTFNSLFLRLTGQYTKDKVSWSQTIKEDLVNYIYPVNVPVDYTANSYVNVSIPVRAVQLNWNATWEEGLNKNMTYINTVENINTLLTHGLDMNVEDRKKESWNVKMGGAMRITRTLFSASESGSFFRNADVYSNLRYTPGKKWSFESNATVRNFAAQGFDKAVTVPLLTARMSYFFLEDEKASLSLDGFDLLDTYTGFERLSVTNFLMEREWNTIGRYVMLTISLRAI